MKPPKEKSGSTRQATILEAAKHAFMRFGYKKTSLDDVATAAGLSRQGLYLHFSSKAELFRGVVLHFVEEALADRHRVLAKQDIELEVKLLEAFVVSHGAKIGSENFQELASAANEFVGDVLHQAEKAFASDVTELLREFAVTKGWQSNGISTKQVAELLLATSTGIKCTAKSSVEYRRRMKIAVQVICG